MQKRRFEAIVIGASAGGPDTLCEILSSLPKDFALPLLIVQHRLATAEEYLVNLLREYCILDVSEAEDKMLIRPNAVIIAPANYHMLVERNKTISLSIDAKVNYSRPSIDVLFQTASEAYLSRLVGIVLTGANADGTQGLKTIKANGGLTIAQTPESAQSPMMPSSAIRANVVDRILSPTEISRFLDHLPEYEEPYESL